MTQTMNVLETIASTIRTRGVDNFVEKKFLPDSITEALPSLVERGDVALSLGGAIVVLTAAGRECLYRDRLGAVGPVG